MDPLRVIASQHGVFLTQEAMSLGHTGRTIAAAVRHRLWHRVRRGAFVPFDVWQSADAETRHLIVASAIHRSYGDRVVFSHVTAALMHGIAVWGVDLSHVHVTRLDGGAGRVERDVVHHEAFSLGADDVTRMDGRLVSTPARATLESAILGSTESALVGLDSALHLGKASGEEIGNVYDLIQHWPATQHLQIAVRMADARAESVGESRARWLFFAQGLPAPQLQYEVYDESGQLIGICDFAWLRQRTLGEFDGRAKYSRLLRPGQTPADAVFAEKRREDALRRATTFGMLRFVWDDLNRPVVTGRRIRDYLDPAA